MAWSLTIIVLLILLNGFFAMSEFAVISARRVRLQRLAHEGRRGARTALTLIDDPSRFLSTVQVGITLVGILAGAYGGTHLAGPLDDLLAEVPLLAPYSSGLAIALVVLGIGYFTLILGELVPKRLALHHTETIATIVAHPMRLLATLGAPLVWLLALSTNAVLRVLRLGEPGQQRVTEEEVKALIEEGTQSGVFEPTEREMIEGVLRLADRSVRAIMTPRGEVVWLDLAEPAQRLRADILDSTYSRFPAGREQIDELLGVVDTKDLLDQLLRGEAFDPAACVKQPLMVFENTSVIRLLEMFRASGVHMAAVIDEYGSLQGIVTLTDITAAIAGELPELGQAFEPEAVRAADGSWLIDGSASIDTVERLVGLRNMREGEDFQTLAGFVLARLDRIPDIGEAFEWQGQRFEIVDKDGPRIDRIRILPAPDEPAQQEDESLR